MDTINIGRTLLRKRKEKGITQDELARYIGVSKASVSKWETGASFPDIAFLPQLATYFDISIDELMGYDPQMTKEDIRKLYKRLTDDLDKKPAEEVFYECRSSVKDYYSCYPLLMQMAIFMINNVGLFPDIEQRSAILDEAVELVERIRTESEDSNLAHQAVKLEALCYLGLQKPDTALVLLEDSLREQNMPAELLAFSAYQMKGDAVEAKRVLQTGLYESLVIDFNYLVNYLSLVTDDTPAFEETVARTDALSQAFDLPHLHPAMQVNIEFVYALTYAMRGEADQSIDALERVVKLLDDKGAVFELHGDAYFNLVDSWLADLDNGTQLPRSISGITESFVDAMTQHPAFASMKDDKRFKKAVSRLEKAKQAL